MSTPGPSSTRPHQPPQYSVAKSRVLACIVCQQRKVKCDRKFPCANCVKHKVQCVPTTQPRPRRRRFPERQLLDRLRSYEELLRQNKIKFEPLHSNLSSAAKGVAREESEDSEDEQPESEGGNGSIPSKPRSEYEAKYGLSGPLHQRLLWCDSILLKY